MDAEGALCALNLFHERGMFERKGHCFSLTCQREHKSEYKGGKNIPKNFMEFIFEKKSSFLPPWITEDHRLFNSLT